MKTAAVDGGQVKARWTPAVLGWTRLARVFQKVDRTTADCQRAWGLTVAQFDVLARVGADEGLTQQDLARALLVTKGNICQLLDRMETMGLIVRVQEGRANRLYLTDAGWRCRDVALPAQETLIEQRFAALTNDEQGELLRLLRKLDRALG